MSVKHLLFLACFFLNLYSHAQPIATVNSLQIRPGFSIGDSKTFLVREESKTDGWGDRGKSKSEFKIKFSVLDTTKGYTIEYTVETLKATNKHMTLHSLVAKITDKIRFVYRIGPLGWVDSLLNLVEVQKQILTALDSVSTMNTNEVDGTLIYHLREALKKPEGIQICVEPLMIFNNAFNQSAFRMQKDYIAANRYDIFNKPLIPGVIIAELKAIKKDENLALVTMDFKGNRDSAAKYMAPVFQQIYASLKGKAYNNSNLPTEMRNDFFREYDIILSSGWPKRIHNKSIVFYMEKITTNTSIEMINEQHLVR